MYVCFVVLLRSVNVPLAVFNLYFFWPLCQLLSSNSLRTHQGQTAHTWPPSYCVQTQPQIPVVPSLSESYNPPALQQPPQGPEGLKESWIQEMGLREGSEKSNLEL